MSVRAIVSQTQCGLRATALSLAVMQLCIGPVLAAAASSQNDLPSPGGLGNAQSPIKHVIVIIGENRSFDHVFATYQPGGNQLVWNLLSEGIINADGTPGPNFSKAQQSASADQAPDTFLLSPAKVPFPGQVLPAPLAGGPTDSYIKGDSLSLAQQSENGLPSNYYAYLVSGGSGLKPATPDTRIANVNA